MRRMIRKIWCRIKKRFEPWQDMDAVKKEVREARKNAPPPRKWARETEWNWRFCKHEQETIAEWEKRMETNQDYITSYGKEQ